MTPDKDGNLVEPKQNTEAPKDTLLQPENTSDAHNVGQWEHPKTKGPLARPVQPGYCEKHLKLGCEACS